MKKGLILLTWFLLSQAWAGEVESLAGFKKVAVIGDSITEDGGYVAELKKLCPNYVFDNFGRSGETTVKIRSRVRATGTDLASKTVGLWEYDVVIVLAGVNNIDDPNQVISDLAAIYYLAKTCPDRFIKVVAITLTPWKGYSTWNWQKQQNTERVNRFILSQPKNVDVVVDVYHSLGDEQDPRQMREGLFRQGDPLHPRGLGQTVIGREIFEYAFAAKPAVSKPYFLN